MKQIEAIKSEVERRLKSIHEWKVGWERKLPLNRNKTYYKNAGKEAAYDAILSFIESLEKELPGIEQQGIPGKDFIPVEWVDTLERYGKWKVVKVGQEPKIKGWVARGCDGLTVYDFRPKKGDDGYYVGKWIGVIDDSFAPEMTREDEPIEVELIINKV